MHAETLQASELWRDQLGLLLESTGEGIFGVDLGGHCMFINRAGARMLGFEPAEVLGRNMHELTHHSHADGRAYPDTDCPIFNAFRQGLSCRIDTEVFWRRDHTAFAVEYSSYPIVRETHQAVFMITHDVDEAILLADRILLMSNGSESAGGYRPGGLAEVVHNTLPKSRKRAGLHHLHGYYELRNHIVDFLVTRALAGATH